MEIYFVRHGQTGGNVAHRHQAEHTPLTEEGKRQVAEAAKRIAELSPTHLLSSTYVRTLETANIIGNEIDMTAETSPLFIEVHRPEKLYGHHHFTVPSIWYIGRWYLGLVGGETMSDEGESYQALRARIASARTALEQYPQDARLVVVSHSIFINLFVAHLCSNRRMTFLKAALIWRMIRGMKNASITHVRYLHTAKGCKWSVVKE